jgi:hypothetical protein
LTQTETEQITAGRIRLPPLFQPALSVIQIRCSTNS